MKYESLQPVKVLLMLAILVLALFVVFGPPDSAKVRLGAEIPANATATNSSTTVATTTATQILAPNTSVNYRAISNLGAAHIFITCNSTSTGFVAGTGRAINASTTFEMTEENGNLCRNGVWGISPTAVTVAVSATEY